MILALLLAAQTATPDVVVTGKRLEALQERCARGTCSPLRDAQVSIALAEEQFREGRYVAAKRTLAGAASRNKRHAATHPRPVAAIYEAYATVSWHEGDQDAYRRAVADQVRTLRDHLPADDAHVKSAAVAYGEMWSRLGKPREAERAYAQAASKAIAAGSNDVAVRALLAQARARHRRGDRSGAAAALASAEALASSNPARIRGAIAVMRARLAATESKGATVDDLASGLGDTGLSRPVLVWAPPYQPTARDSAQFERSRALNAGASPGELFADVGVKSSDLNPVRWADVGFWIRPDGRTAEPEVLRGSVDTAWTTPYLAQVAGRRYTRSLVTEPNDPGSYRIERFTLRPNYVTPNGSLIRRRAGPGRLEVVELTDTMAEITAAR